MAAPGGPAGGHPVHSEPYVTLAEDGKMGRGMEDEGRGEKGEGRMKLSSCETASGTEPVAVELQSLIPNP